MILRSDLLIRKPNSFFFLIKLSASVKLDKRVTSYNNFELYLITFLKSLHCSS